MSEYNVDYGVVKKPHNDRPLTNSEVNEWMKCRESFWYFAKNYAQVLGPKGMTYFEAREYQVEMLDVIDKNRFIVINAPR